MNSFVKPSARIKFGLAIASSTTLAASPFMGLPAFAATITVDTCTQFGSGAQVGLGDAINAANAAAGADIIDMTSLSSCTITVNSAMQIAESVTINGGDQVTLQQGGYNQIFTFTTGVGIDFVLNDMVIDGMDAGTESGIDISPTVASTLTLNDVTMRDFDRTALRSRTVYTTLSINNSTFSNNYAPGFSAGIYSRGDISVVNSTFTGNISRNMFGGAILVRDSSMTVSGSTFTDNVGRSGGALAAWGVDSSLTILDDAASTFSDNSAYFVAGGAIYVYDGSLLIEGATAVTHTFDGNSAPSQGGAIGVFHEYAAPDIQIDGDLTLTDNSAGFGGAVGVLSMYQGSGAIDFTGNITAYGNRANSVSGVGGGGVLYFGARDGVPANSVLPELDVTFSGSTVNLHDNSTDNRGGALYARSRKGNIYIEMTADQVSMTYNEAVHGGAVALTSFNSVDDATADYANSFSITEGVADISFNRATRYGGAIYSKGFDVDLIGGGVASVYDALGASEAVAMHEFASNRADLDGGFIWAKGHSDVTIQLASMHDNTALSSALMRGLYSDFSVVGNSIVDNGHIPGSVVFNITYGRLEAYANLFAGNRALSSMLRTRASDTILAGNTFIDNHTGDSTIFSNGSSELGLVVQHNTFINNVSVGSSYSAFIDGTYPTGDPTLETITGNIFYSLQANDKQIYLNYSSKLGPGNLFNAVATSTYSLAPLLMPFSPLLGDTYSMLVTAEQLNLTGLDNWANAGNLGLNLKTVGLGEGSVAIDLMKSAPNPSLSSFGYDGRFENLFMDGTRDPGHGTGFDVGAFEAFNPNRPQDDGDQPPATEPNVLITSVSKGEISSGGDSFKVFGRGLDGVSVLYVGDVRVGFDVVSSTELAVTTGSLPAGRFAITAVADDGRAVYQEGILVVAGADANSDPKFWTKRLSDGTAKIYASNIVGQGKVQFFVNGKEVAWVRAVDGNDPKLRQAKGSSYLVRTVELAESGKTRLEVKVNGKRVRFTTYVN